MEIEYLRLLQIMREVYDSPRDMERFHRYLRTLTGGTDDLVTPIISFNPMAKPRVAEKLDVLLALGAERAGAAAANESQSRLPDVPGAITTGLELADDAEGAWTNRYTTEAASVFSGRGKVARPFATALLYVTESPTLDEIRRRIQTAIYRHTYQRTVGLPKTLSDLLRQEGLAHRFAGAEPSLSAHEVARAQDRMAPFLGSSNYPDLFACMFGDEGAEALGYPPLGLPSYAGFAVSVAVAEKEGWNPVAILTGRTRHGGPGPRRTSR